METKTTGQLICEYRKKKSLTQKALSEQLNVTDKAVSKWERDIARPDINTIPKLAEVLEIPVELLLNIPIISKSEVTDPVEEKVNQDDDIADISDEWDLDDGFNLYRENVIRLLKKGLLGFSGGFIFVLLTSIWGKESFHFGMALAVGLFVSGVPYGWEILTKITQGLYVVGSIPIMLLAAFIKFAIALILSWAIYPIVLLYNLTRAQRKGSKYKILFATLLIAFIILLVVLIIWQLNLSAKR